MVSSRTARARPEELLESQLGSYRVTSLLQTGGMGNVFLGEHVFLQRSAAIKTARADAPVPYRRLQRRLLVEARCLAAVDHPNVVTVHDFGLSDGGVAFLAMDLLDGKSLDVILDQEGPLQVPAALHIARETARGLAAFHVKSIVCADVKPDNLMIVSGPLVGRPLERRPWVKLIDLGAAQPIRESNLGFRQAIRFGTSWYMSPEAVLGFALDERADVYSLATLIFEMIVGQVPFRLADDQEVMEQQLMAPVPLLSEVTSEVKPSSLLERLVADCLSKAPDDRPSSMYELLDRLDEADLQWRKAHGNKAVPAGMPSSKARLQYPGAASLGRKQ